MTTSMPMKAIVLYKTDIQIDCDKTNIREQIDDIFDDASNYDIKEFSNNDEMFQLIFDGLGKPKVGVTACNVLETRDTVIAGYFIDIAETLNYGTPEDSEEIILSKMKETYDNEHLNMFGSQITAQHVTGNLVIVKNRLVYEVKDNNVKTSMEPLTITVDELKDAIESKFLKSGLVVDTNGETSVYKYIMNPMEHLILSDKDYKDHYIYHEYEVYTHVMMIITDVREANKSNDNINETASFLAGGLAKGRVFIAMYKKPDYSETPAYANLNIERLKKILEIRKVSTDLTTGMSCSDKEYINFDKILELEWAKHKDKPTVTLDSLKGECINKK
jgi:hypothetical protein